MTVRVERELCIGSGYCARFAPAVFKLDDEEIAVVIDPAGNTETDRIKAANSCPAGAIYIDEDGSSN